MDAEEAKARILQLEEELLQIKDLIVPRSLVFPRGWKLDPGETNLLRYLVTSPNGFRSSEDINDTMILLSQRGAQDGAGLVSARLCTLRKKLKPFGIHIAARFSSGLDLPKESLMRIKELMAQEIAERLAS